MPSTGMPPSLAELGVTAILLTAAGVVQRLPVPLAMLAIPTTAAKDTLHLGALDL